MCFSPQKHFIHKQAKTEEDFKLIKKMMKDNDFYYTTESWVGWRMFNLKNIFNIIHYDFNTPIGFSTFELKETGKVAETDYKAKPFIWVLYLLVDRKYQNLGYGTKIINFYKVYAERKNKYMLVIDLDREENYQRLLTYYKKQGFIEFYDGFSLTQKMRVMITNPLQYN